MGYQYKLLDEISETLLEADEYRQCFTNLIDKYSKEKAISRRDVIHEFKGESLKSILSQLNFSGDAQKGIDMIVHDILLYVDDFSQPNYVDDDFSQLEEDSEIMNIDCILLEKEKCIRTEKSKAEYHGRKLCGRREYTTECKMLVLRKKE